jgi:hypothetical protein
LGYMGKTWERHVGSRENAQRRILPMDQLDAAQVNGLRKSVSMRSQSM